MLFQVGKVDTFPLAARVVRGGKHVVAQALKYPLQCCFRKVIDGVRGFNDLCGN